MKSTIENYIHGCEKCSRFNINRKKPPGKLVPINPPQGILELVGMDFWDPTSQPSSTGNRYVLVITDYLSKFAVAKALPNNTARQEPKT
ncbi:unnamed protein product, partial [Didymodactylos carnosus]